MTRCESGSTALYTIQSSIHPWHYSPFRALASLKSCLHSCLFSALLLHPRVPNICNASFCTASFHLILGLPTGLVLCNKIIAWRSSKTHVENACRPLGLLITAVLTVNTPNFSLMGNRRRSQPQMLIRRLLRQDLSSFLSVMSTKMGPIGGVCYS